MAKILFIQQERIFLTMYGRALVLEEHEVVGCDGFKAGRKSLRGGWPDIVLVGFHGELRDKDLDEIRQLRKIDHDVPIIVLSYRTATTPVLEATRAGASLVVKQLSNAQLIDLVREICRKRSAKRRAAPQHEHSYEPAIQWHRFRPLTGFVHEPTSGQ